MPFNKVVQGNIYPLKSALMFCSFVHEMFFKFSSFFKDYKLDFFLRQLWNDPRLKHDWNKTLALSNTMLDKIWVPDTYFENSKSSKFHKVTMVNKLLSISPDGGVHYNAR